MATKDIIFDESMLAETLPTGLINVGDDNHIANMANFSMYANAKEAVELPKGTPPDDPSKVFGNWVGNGEILDTKLAAADLKRRGLQGADQIVETQPNLSDADSIRNSQADWKPAVIQQILTNARKFNIRTREEVLANKDVLVSNSKWRDAINNDSFKNLHGNWWEIITDSILPEQYAKTGTQETNSIVKN